MPTVFWGSISSWHFDLPNTLLTWLLLLVCGAVFLALLFRDRYYWNGISNKRLGFLILLSGSAFLFSQFFPTDVSLSSARRLPFGIIFAPESILSMLSAAPYLLAAAMMGPTAGLIVGFFTGLGRALGLTHLLYDPFLFAFAAWIAGMLYSERRNT